MVPLVRAAALTNFLEVAESLGFNPREALRHAGLSQSLLKDPEQRISTDAVVALLEEAAAGSGCDTFGLRMAESRQLSNFGVVSLLITHQATLRDALVTTIDYRHLLNESLAMQLEDAGRLVILRQELVATKPGRQGTELALGAVFRMCKALMGAQWQPNSVNFVHSAPSDLRLHNRLFACRLVFDSEFNGIVFAASDLEAANPHADPAMARYARQFVESLPQSHAHSIVLEVRRAIYLMLPMGRATSETVALGLGMSVRSMQRQLDEVGASFTSLLNAVRSELAPRYMENPKFSLNRISELLGYSTQGSFTRWFTAQFGLLPSRWREREEGIHRTDARGSDRSFEAPIRKTAPD
ncbi:AraC family transcriptional regulator [Variovorax sp. dw_954]|uniref:AraC family transcriptional regulator n=1 Tax=Variovorax sp. dw_954 TaxID=2720078 RepID=UPI001BD5B143|nr:AraC family transcriptional regulator [Variovorax sp. dw_954]